MLDIFKQAGNNFVRIFFTLTFSLFILNTAYCQPSLNIDSATVVTISSLDTIHSKNLLRLHSYMAESNLYLRIDTLKYDFAFIEAKMVDSLMTIKEWYFNSQSSNPERVFINNELIDKNASVYQLSFYSLKTKYKKLKPIQALPYTKRQVCYHGCIRFPKKHYKKKRIDQLKKTYQIQTSVDSRISSTKISIQTPPKRPIIKIKLKGGGF